jgi:hypothetical protein
MKEYTITMNFMIEAEDADYEKINEFAEQLSENIMSDDRLVCNNDIEIVGITVSEIEGDDYEDEDNLYLGHDDDE